MPAPCSAEVIELVERLLAPAPGAPRLSHRQIAILARVGRDVVDRIAAGTYRQRNAARQANATDVSPHPLVPPSPLPFRYPDLHAAKIWCRPCWAWVAPPCLACQVRAIKGAEAAARRKPAA